MVKLLTISVTLHMPQNRLSGAITYVTLCTINGVVLPHAMLLLQYSSPNSILLKACLYPHVKLLPNFLKKNASLSRGV